LRIAIFGDSFTHGDEVELSQTWGYFLEEALNKAGVSAEVLNFGVCGYGMDQAYLRWKKYGREFSPDIVIFGFQAENLQRNLNIVRMFYRPGDEIFFSKPRFIIKGKDLHLLNVPCIEPWRLPEILRNLNSWDLLKYEYWAMSVNYEEKLWQKSMFLRAIWNVFTKERTSADCFQEFLRVDKEPAQVALKIVEAFKKDVEASGSKFLVVYFPQMPALARMLAKLECVEDKLLKKIDSFATVIHPEGALAEQLKKTPWRAMKFLHYSAEENQVVAQEIAKFILEHDLAVSGQEK
jgi:hypothetical protein